MLHIEVRRLSLEALSKNPPKCAWSPAARLFLFKPMPTICPKCRAVRPATTEAPDWQCPSCGVAYAKVGGMRTGPARLGSSGNVRSSAASRSGGGLFTSIPWFKLLAVSAIVYGACIPYLIVKGRHMKDGFDSDEFLALLTR